MATHGLSLNTAAAMKLAKRATKLARDVDVHFHSAGAPSVLMDEGLALLHEPELAVEID